MTSVRISRMALATGKTLLSRSQFQHQLAGAPAQLTSSRLLQLARFSWRVNRNVGRQHQLRLMATTGDEVRPPGPQAYPYGPQVSLETNAAEIKASSSDPLSWNGDLLVIGVFEDSFETVDEKPAVKNEELRSLDRKLGGAITDIVTLFEFTGKEGSSQAVRTTGTSAKFVSLIGLGSAGKASVTGKFGPSTFQTFGSAIASAGKSNKAKSVGVFILGGGLSDEDKTVACGGIANGIVNGAYEATRFKSKKASTAPPSVEVLFASGQGATDAIARGIALAKGALFTRYLVEAPPNVCTPTYIASAAQEIADAAPGVMSLKVLEKEDCVRMGMGCYLGVAEASDEPPKFIHLTYTPKGEIKSNVAIVGKGLTFDSGGYNLKAGPGSMIEMMKFDMGGSAATLGAAKILSLIQPPGVQVHFIVASCENMVAGRGLRPGDILVASNGKTVEVNNTDAEGRLTLADAILYAQNECKATSIVDIATLTGACIVALGTGIGGMWSPSDELAHQLTSAANSAGEKFWRMPLEQSYAEDLKSPIADMKNTGSRWGGAITAALFLKEFVKTDEVCWAHLDIAGPVWSDKLGGATGFGAQTLAEWAGDQGKII